MSGVVHEHNGPTFGHVYCLRCQETARDLGIEALWTYLPEYVTCSGNALSGPVAGDGGETGTGGPPERHGAVQDEWRAALAEALEDRFSYATQYATVIIDWDEEAEAIAESPALRDLIAERDTCAAQVHEGLALADEYEAYVADRGRPEPGSYDHGLNMAQKAAAIDIRRALGTPTTGGGE